MSVILLIGLLPERRGVLSESMFDQPCQDRANFEFAEVFVILKMKECETTKDIERENYHGKILLSSGAAMKLVS